LYISNKIIKIEWKNIYISSTPLLNDAIVFKEIRYVGLSFVLLPTKHSEVHSKTENNS
jgi:hypothetical protein